MTDKREQAYQDYISGMKYADIAKKYEVTESAVKQWVRRDWKNKNLTLDKKVTTEKVTAPPQRKRGGANNIKHGAYCGFFSDILTDEERAVMDEQEPNIEQKYIEEINILTIREKRLLKQIAKYQEVHHFDDEEFGILTSVTRVAGEIDNKHEKRIIKDTNAAYLYLKVLEEQLIKVQAEKSRNIKYLADYRFKIREVITKEKQFELEKEKWEKSSAADVESLIEAAKELKDLFSHDTPERDITDYEQ